MKSRLKRFWREYGGVIGWGAVILWELCTPFIFKLTSLSRGSRAMGGEIFWPAVPPLIWLVATCVKDTLAHIKKDKHE